MDVASEMETVTRPGMKAGIDPGNKLNLMQVNDDRK